LAAGVLSFLSPCVLPIVPPYLAYMSGISLGEMKSGRKPLLAASFFVLGLSTVFLLMGAASSAFGAYFLARSLLLAGYALGLGLPFLLVAAFFPRLTPLMALMKRHMERIEKIMGLMLWTIGLLMLTGGFSQFSYWLLEHLPALSQFG